MIYELIAIIAPVFVCAALGYGWARLGRPYDTEFVTTLVTNIGAPCLEIHKIAAGRHFLPAFNAGSPNFQIIALGGGKTQIAGGEVQNPIGETQELKHLLGIPDQRLQFLIG